MLAIPLALILSVGGITFGRDFYDALWLFITEGLPEFWEDNVTTSRYYRAFENSLWIAIIFIVLVTGLAFIAARLISPGVGQWLIFVAFTPAAVLIGLIALASGVIADIGVTLLVPGEKNRQTVQDFRRGMMIDMALYLAWEMTIGSFLYLWGMHASMQYIVFALWSIILYGVAAYAFGWKVVWIEYVMSWLGLGSFIVCITIITLLVYVPGSSGYVEKIGINPGSAVHRGVADTSAFDRAEKTYQERMRALCTTEITQLETSMKSAKDIRTLEALKKDIHQRREQCYK